MQYDAFVTAPSPFEAVRRVAAISLKFHTLAGGRACVISPLSEIELQEGGTYCRVRVKWALPIHNFAIQTSDGNDIAFWYVCMFVVSLFRLVCMRARDTMVVAHAIRRHVGHIVFFCG